MAERLTLLPRPRGSLPEERKRGEKVDLTDWIAPQFLIDILEAAKMRMSHQGEKFTEQDLEPLMRFLER